MGATLSLSGVGSVCLIGAHPDDIEIGAGGLLLSLAQAQRGLAVRYLLLTGSAERQAEAREAASAFLPAATLTFLMHDLPDGRLPAAWGSVKQLLHDCADLGPTELVVGPWIGDAHQDHRLVAELIPTVFRHAYALHYEIPKWDGDLGRPNVYLPLPEELAKRKAALLAKHFASQHQRSWWDEEVFLGLARLRGMECHARYAEAFHSTKAVVHVSGPPPRLRRSRA